MSPDAAEMLAAVEQSPQATAAHDRAAWVELFTDDGRVEDPFGSRPHIGHAQIARFYDTFIGPRHITFHRDLDIVAGTSVIRDLTLEVGMGSDVVMVIPAFLRYDLCQSARGWQIARLRAYWELPAMIAQILGHGLKALPATVRLSAGLLRNQRVVGTAGFLSGFGGAGSRGKQLVEHALAGGLMVEVPRECRWDKVIVAGNTVAAAIRAPAGRGVLFVALDDRGRTITDVNLFRSEKWTSGVPTDPG